MASRAICCLFRKDIVGWTRTVGSSQTMNGIHVLSLAGAVATGLHADHLLWLHLLYAIAYIAERTPPNFEVQVADSSGKLVDFLPRGSWEIWPRQYI